MMKERRVFGHHLISFDLKSHDMLMSVTVPLTQENLHRSKKVTDPVPYAAVGYICIKFDSVVTNMSSMAVISFAVLLLLLGEGLDYAHSKLEAREKPALLQRMERLESLLLQQDAKLTSQGNLLLRQEQKLASLKKITAGASPENF